MKITDVISHILVQPDYDVGATSSAQDDFVVEIHTDEGVTGIGETDLNPWIAQACIEAPGTHTMGVAVKDILIGRDPLDIDGLWSELYVRTAMNGRRGAMINALGAVEMALYDLKGRALGVPVHELLGGAITDRIVPYASLQPETGSFSAYRDSLVEWACRAIALDFRAIKIEVTLSGPYAHNGMDEPDERITEVIAAVRRAVGPRVTLMVDVEYLWPDADAALRTLRDWTEFDLTFVETPLWPDDLDGHRRLSREQPIPIASGEWLSTHFEFQDLMDRGGIKVAQPDVGRVGGFGESLHVCDHARARGVSIVPHAWKSGISIAAAAHLAAVREEVRFVEFLPRELCESPLRKNLTTEELEFRDGVLTVPTKPGLGVELDRTFLEQLYV